MQFDEYVGNRGQTFSAVKKVFLAALDIQFDQTDGPIGIARRNFGNRNRLNLIQNAGDRADLGL